MTLWPTRADPRLAALGCVANNDVSATLREAHAAAACRIVRCVDQFGNEVGNHSVRLDQHNPSRPPERPWLDTEQQAAHFPTVLPPGSMEATKRDRDNRHGYRRPRARCRPAG